MATKKVSAPAPRVRKPAPEVEKDFAKVRQEVQEARESFSSKSDALERERQAEVRANTAGLTAESIVEQISRLGLEVTRALNGLSEELLAEVHRLTALRQAVELERDELNRLHKIDTAATALDQLVRDYEDKKSELETEISSKQAEWEERALNAEVERKEQEEALKKQRQRDIDEYEYKKSLERKRAQDKYDEEIRLREKQNKERQEELEKSWAQREADLAAREQELAKLRKDALEFPATLDRESKNAAAAATKETRAQYEQQLQLLKKEMETEKRLAEMQVKALEDQAFRQVAQIADLQKQLDEAKRQVQDIAIRAIEGASGAKALSHINEIAMEQAKNRQQS